MFNFGIRNSSDDDVVFCTRPMESKHYIGLIGRLLRPLKPDSAPRCPQFLHMRAGCFMAKTDVKSAFRIIPSHPNDFALLGMNWQDSYYFDRCLPMGCSSSWAIFEAFGTVLEGLAMTRLGASGSYIF